MYTDNTQEIVQMAFERGLIFNRSGWFTILGYTKIQGEANMYNAIHQPGPLRDELIHFLEVDQKVIRELSKK